jgi:hypothetical protein
MHISTKQPLCSGHGLCAMAFRTSLLWYSSPVYTVAGGVRQACSWVDLSLLCNIYHHEVGVK